MQSQKFDFAELNIRHKGNADRTLDTVRRAIRMGYDAVVINIDIGNFGAGLGENVSAAGPPSKKRRKKQMQQEQPQNEGLVTPVEIIPDPFLVDETKLDLSSFAVVGKKFRQFSRLTVGIDANTIHKLQHNKKAKLYDVLAVRVPDEQVLLTLQRKGDFVDLVTLDGTGIVGGRIPWLHKQKIVQSCIAVGIHFEITYANALQSSEYRRQFFANARRMMEITRGGRGVVLSSGTDEMIALRGPYDVSNLCTLFDLKPKCGRKFVAINARDVLLRAQTRRTIKGAVYIADLTAANPSVPSASGASAKQVINELAQIEEFRAELVGFDEEMKNEEVRKTEKESARRDEEQPPEERLRKRLKIDEEKEEDLFDIFT